MPFHRIPRNTVDYSKHIYYSINNLDKMTVNPNTAADQKGRYAKQLDQSIAANLEIMKTDTAASVMKKFGPTLTTEEELPGTPCSFHLQ